ncbi:MAG: recombination regulator RecX [Treponema sp.]|jgi:regulatory protein|nr:recombination regulator RecX [Treponema sp.]
MFVISLKTEAGGETGRIQLSDGSLFSYKICYLPADFGSVSEGNEITAIEEESFRFASECLRAEKAALRLITRAEQCTSGLSRKLEQKRHSAACVNAVLSQLTELKLVDDSRFARLWLESRLRLARSPRRLQSALANRGIDRETAQTALKTVLNEETEQLLLSRFAEKRLRKTDERQLKYLLKSEGFSREAINQYFEECDL